MQPLIGLTSDVTYKERTDTYAGLAISATETVFSEAIWQCGGIPVILPQVKSQIQANRLIERLDGLVVIGGHDITPTLYDEEPHPKVTQYKPERDQSDLAYIDASYRQNKAILGICRGLQIMNVYKGGSLYQDLSQYELLNIQHVQVAKPEVATHSIHLVNDTMIANIFDTQKLMVNSFHHQAIKTLGENMVASAYSQDGVIEAAESTIEGEVFFGVQWHPETLFEYDKNHLKVFEKLVDAS